jgi:hypothetical protein
MAPERYFLVIYDLKSQKAEVQEFGTDFERAAAAYAMLEERHHDDDQIEVVLVGADSIETIHRTHSHYFAKAAEELFEEFLAAR